MNQALNKLETDEEQLLVDVLAMVRKIRASTKYGTIKIVIEKNVLREPDTVVNHKGFKTYSK